MQLVSDNNGIFPPERLHDISIVFINELVLVHRRDQFRVVRGDHAFNFLTPLIVHILKIEGVGENREVV